MSLDLSIVRYRTVFLNLLPESWYECSTSLSAGCLGNPSREGDKVHLSWSGHLLTGSSHIQNTGCNSGTGKANVYVPLIHILTFSFIHVSENSLISSIPFLEPRLNCNWTFHQPNPPQLYGFPRIIPMEGPFSSQRKSLRRSHPSSRSTSLWEREIWTIWAVWVISGEIKWLHCLRAGPGAVGSYGIKGNWIPIWNGNKRKEANDPEHLLVLLEGVQCLLQQGLAPLCPQKPGNKLSNWFAGLESQHYWISRAGCVGILQFTYSSHFYSIFVTFPCSL